MSTDVLAEVKSDEGQTTDVDRLATLLAYLKIIFRDKNKTFKVRLAGIEDELKQNILPYAIMQGITTKQVRFVWEDSQDLIPHPKLETDEKEKPLTVTVNFPRKLYEIIESDFLTQIPLTYLSYMENPEAYVEGYLKNLEHGKQRFLVEPETLQSTSILSKMLIETYEMWRQIP